MIIRSFRDLEDHARKEYARKFASVPEPRIVNADALVAFTAPREFTYGGVGYRAPPLSFRLGVRLLVAANALGDLRKAQAPAPHLEAAVRLAASLLAQTFRPIRWLPRLLWGAQPFRRIPAEAMEQLLRWLVYVPDDSSFPPSTKRVTLDLVDALTAFAREFPGWLDRRGDPLSWAHYLYGQRHLSRVRAREDLRLAIATRYSQADKRDFAQYLHEESAAAGWN